MDEILNKLTGRKFHSEDKEEMTEIQTILLGVGFKWRDNDGKIYYSCRCVYTYHDENYGFYITNGSTIHHFENHGNLETTLDELRKIAPSRTTKPTTNFEELW